ncbi:MAG TPA: DNA internalization-related competence protein ComEC/Rec2 [Vicinamibacterales bacterium]|nr:DNA internalization-related competence protein ComEC/Rec2 [Vicinamibacterales bacterium]
MSAPAAVVAIPLVAGIAGGILLGVTPWIAVLVAPAAWTAACAAFVARRPRLFVLACAVAAAAAGVLLGASAHTAASNPSLLAWYRTSPATSTGDAVTIEGRLSSDAARTPFGTSAVLDVDRASDRRGTAIVHGGVRLSIGGELAARAVPAWRGGRRLRARALLHEPIDFQDPGVPGDRERLQRDGIVLLGSVKSAALVAVVARGSWFDELAASVRAHVRTAIAAAVGHWSRRSAGVVTAILIGDRTGLDADDERRLQEAGTYHVIAISGGNIALITAVLLAVARAGRLPRRVSLAATLLLVAFYGDLAGLAPSVERATLAAVVYLAARIVDQRGPAVNALASAAGISAAASPLTVVDAGFILSFGATLGIVVAADRLMPDRAHDRSDGRSGRAVRALLIAGAALGAATISAEAVLGPVSARLFGRVSAAGLLLNFAAIPLMSVAEVAGLATVVAWPLSRIAALASGFVAHLATAGLLRSAAFVEIAPWLVVDVPPPVLWLVACWYAALIVAWRARRRTRTAAVAVLAGASALILWSPGPLRAGYVAPPPPGWTRVVFLDVGQGDATLLLPAAGNPILIDAGGVPASSFDLGRRVTVPALWALGVRRLGVLVLTHGDPDHIGGAPAVVRALTPSEIWEGVPVPRHEPLRALRREAAARHVRWRQVRVGRGLVAGMAAIRVLNPPEPDWERQRVRNDDSIVLEVRVGDVVFVLPGDISREVEPAVAARFEPAPFVIVKAPHHGSASSSAEVFVARTHPAAVVFSEGARNHFGHPAPVVVERYRAAGARVYRTDRDGAVIVDTDGHRVLAWTWTGSRAWLR